MASRLQEKLKKYFNNENPQRDILLDLLERDKNFTKKFIKLFIGNDIVTSHEEFFITAEVPEHFGRPDLIFKIGDKIILQIEVKSIQKTVLDEEDKTQFLNYVKNIRDERKIGLLIRYPYSDFIDAQKKLDVYCGAVSWRRLVF